MKKGLFLFLFFLFFFLPNIAFADLNCCGSQGGNYFCDYTTGKLYCKNGTVSTECTCQAINTPSPTPYPTLTPTPTQTPTPPKCPEFSTYYSSSQTCNCNAGYIANNNECVTNADFCWTKYGGNSVYDAGNNSCGCASGYTWNDNGTNCISFNNLCQNKLGDESYYNADNKTCECYQGYEIQNNKCIVIPTQVITTLEPTSEEILVTDTPYPIPTATPVKKLYPTPTIYLNPNLIPTINESDVLGVKDYLSVKKENQNGLVQILQGIWNFITHIF